MEKEVQKTMPMSNKEYYSFRNLMGMVNNFDAYAGDLRTRCGLIDGGWRDMMLIAKKSEQLMQRLMYTIPENKLINMKKDLHHMVCEVRVAYDYAMRDEREYTYCPTEAIDRLVSRVLTWECLSCDKNAKEAKRCPVYKDISACYHWTLPQNGDKCPMAGVMEEL